uniref:Maestro heat-like repeat family member 1 n=1 Tax=Myripristis murdjan TaxID=586833 RepID=A0A667YA62_9TELE
MCQDYLTKHPKLVVSHRVVILQTIELIVGSRIEEISYPRIKSIISLASDEMTRSKEVVPDWQQAASNILVAVGNKHINDIMEEILSKFQPGVLPHFFVVQTLASLSDSNVYGMVPFLNAVLGTMLPMLCMAKQDNMKWVFSSALCHFSDSILEYLANLDKAPDPTVRKDTFSSEIYAAYDILFNNWLQSREPKIRLTVAEAVGSMSHLMASDKLEEQIPKLIPAMLSLYKKNSEHYIISKSLCQVLDASVNMGSRVLETQLDSLLVALHQQVCCPIDYSNPPTVKNHNEVLRCFSLLANSFPDRLVMFVLQKLENSNERSRMGSLAVLRHLINSSTSMMETKKLLILASIRQPMADHSNKVKKRVVQVISAMAHHGYLELEGGDLLVRFIVQHCALPDTIQRGQKPIDPEEVTNEALRTMCDNTLHLLTTTVGRLADVLWPMLLYYLTPPQFSNATSPLCKSLIVLGSKKRNNQEASFNIDFTHRGHGAPSLSLLSVLSVNIHPSADILWEKEIPPLLFLYQCIGVTLQQCYNKEVVKKQLQEILLTARHSDTIEREGVAMGIGLCANSHLEGTLAKLDEFGKSDAFKKSPSIFNLLKERNDVEIEKVKSTLILCYGQVALNAPPEQILNRIDHDILRCISKHFNTKDLTMKLSLIQSVGLIAKAISECVKRQGYVFSRKQELIAVMLDFIKAEPADTLRTPVRHLVMTTCANLMYPSLITVRSSNMVSFHNLGALLGRLSPRCSDPHPAVRTAAVDCIYTLLYIQFRQNLRACLHYLCLSLYAHMCLSVCVSLCVTISSPVCVCQQLTTLVFMLFEGLVDSQTNCCRAASVILNTLLKNRGAGLQELVTHTHTHTHTEMWMALGADPIIASQIMEMVMEKLVVMAPYVDRKESMMRAVTTKVATNQPLAVSHTRHCQHFRHPVLIMNPHIICRMCVTLGMFVFSCRAMAKHAGPRLPSIVECLCPCLNNIYECQRITVTAFFSELLNHHVVTELLLMDVLMNNMMERISDPCCTVRMLSVRGLGNIAVGSPEKVLLSDIVMYKYCTPHALSDNDDIRCASILLLGNLSKFGSGEPVFKDQIHNVLVSLLLHLVDPNPQVVKACKYAMRVCAPVVGSDQITAMFQNHLHEDKSLHYGEFINDLTKYLVRLSHTPI